MNAKQVLLKAAEIMRKGGYLKGDRGDTSTVASPHCAMGAFDCVRLTFGADSWTVRDAESLLAFAVTPLIPEDGVIDKYNRSDLVKKDSSHIDKICAWNNILCDSAEEVAVQMEKAAELYRGG